MSYRVSLGLCLAVLFVWSLPGTIALRSILMLAAAATLLPMIERKEWKSSFAAMRIPLILLAVLSLWFLVQAFLISRESAWVLGELKGQWLPALLALALGASLAILALRQSAARLPQLSLAIPLVLGLQAALVVILWPWLRSFTREAGKIEVPVSALKLEITFSLSLVLVFVLVDLLRRATGRERLLPVRPAGSMGLLALVASCTYAVHGRNGMLAMAFLLFCTLAIYLFDQRQRLGVRRILAGAALAATLLAVVAVDRYQSDPRWKEMRDTAAIGWSVDIGQFPQPGTSSWPTLADGRPVEHSTLVRAAFLHAGLRLIADDPAGYGYGRNAFGHALQEQGVSARGHAHNGWIDLGVGAGIPGLLLWAAFLGNLMWQGWRSFRASDNPYGLLLVLLAAGHAFRMILDSVNRDHMLQMFLFLAGLLLVLSTAPRAAAKP